MDDNFYKQIVEHSREGYAYHRIITDRDGNPIDYVFLSANPAFEKATGLSRDQIVGKKVTEILPGIGKSSYDWIGNYGKVALTGGSISFEQYSEPLGRWYDVIAYSNEHTYFVTIFRDITSYKQTELELLEYKTSIEQSTEGIALADMDGKVKFVNNAWAKMHGCSIKEPLGLHLNIFHTPEQIENEVTPFIERVITTGSVDGEVGHVRVDGTIFPTQMTFVVIRGEDDKPIEMIGIARDITERKKMEAAQEKSAQYLRNILHTTQDGFWVIDNQKRIVDVNEAYCRMSGYAQDELLAMEIQDLEAIEIPEETDARVQRVLKNGSELFETRHRKKDGSLWDVEVSVTTLERDDDAVMVCFCRDITERKQAEEQLRFQAHIIENSPVIAAYHDKDLNTVWVNRAYQKATGLSLEEIRGRKCYQVWNLSNPCQGCSVITAIETGENAASELTPDNQDNWPETQGYWLSEAAPVRDEQGVVIGAIEFAFDITKLQQAEQEIEYLSFHDGLTGLYNRRFFDEELERLDVPRNLPLTLTMLDVNGLKLTNDAFGHQVGDELLTRVAAVLQNVCRADDIISRIGGDEFAIMLPKTDGEQAERLTKRIQEVIAAEKVEGLPISVSCGWAAKTEEQERIIDVFKTAEDHMYRHKISERNSYRHQTIQLIMQTLYAKSPREQQHSERVSELCGQIGSALSLDVSEHTTAGMLHDIGKVAISESILDKVPPLTDSEWLEIKRHPEAGYSILSSVNDYGPLAECVLAHHERWDGAGYPNGLKGEAIPRMARIIAVADAYDAMVSDRPYRKGMSHSDAMEEIEVCAGSQFDPIIVQVFIEMMREQEPGPIVGD